MSSATGSSNGAPSPAELLGTGTVVVAGLGASGRAARDVLTAKGISVVTVDDAAPAADMTSSAALAASLLGATTMVIASPGWRPDHPFLAAATTAGVPVISEIELGWALRTSAGLSTPWLAITGTNGKTTTVGMLASILAAAGRTVAAVGNVGDPVVSVADDPTVDVLAVELSSFQLHSTRSVRTQAAAVLNVAQDHIDWHGSFEAYAAAKATIFTGAERACVYNLDDPVTEAMVRDADVADGALAVGVGLGAPGVGMLGLVDDVLVDRALSPDRWTHGTELATTADLAQLAGPDGRLAPHVVRNALSAAALALAHGVRPADVRAGLRAFGPGAHRIEVVATAGAISWVDDSKATNAHAAAASLASFAPGSVVWIAGGLAKGATFDDLVVASKGRLRAVVLIGQDVTELSEALARHASDVPVERIDPGETGSVMTRAVRAATVAARAPRPDLPDVPVTVLLAPACASMDQFASYAARGDAFADAARREAAGAA